MTIYFIGFIIALLDIAFGYHLHLFGGSDFIVPVAILLLASVSLWRQWLVALAMYGLIQYYSGLIALVIVAIIILSVGVNYLFARFVDRHNVIVSSLVMSLIVAGLLLMLAFSLVHGVTLAVLGTWLMTLPIIIAWYAWYNWRQVGL